MSRSGEYPTPDQGSTLMKPSEVNRVEVSSPSNLSSDMDFKYFNAPHKSAGLSLPKQDLPDDFFEPTIDELREAQRNLSNATRQRPLLTQKFRDEKEKEKRSRWPETTVRIKFANRSMLAKTFPSSDKIKSVYAFVRGSLREDARVHKFVLYSTPPPRDLKVSDPTVKDKTLYELGLAPASILMFRFLEDDIQLDLPNIPPPLLPSVLSRARDLASPASDPASSPSPSNKLPGTGDIKPSSGPPSSQKKVPKWFKLQPGKK